ncbi:MAG: sortase [Nocardioides sp.]
MSHRRRRRRRSWVRFSSSRTRNLALLGGIGAVLIVAIALPLALSFPAPVPTPSNATSSSSLPYVPPLFPVGQSPGPQPSGGSQPPTRPSNFPIPPAASAGPGVVATRVRIPSLSIDLGIIEGDGIDVPFNLAAHYPGTAWPTGGSNIFLYAHARKGMFLNLWSARVGDQVYMDLADGTTRAYIVDEVMPDVPWNQLSLLNPTPTEQLTLQTCVGVSPVAPRFVVIAHPVA